MVSWLSKKTRPAVVPLELANLGEISGDGKVNIVLHGDISGEQGKMFEALANVDDYNSTSIEMQLITQFRAQIRLKELLRSSGLSEIVRALRCPTT